MFSKTSSVYTYLMDHSSFPRKSSMCTIFHAACTILGARLASGPFLPQTYSRSTAYGAASRSVALSSLKRHLNQQCNNGYKCVRLFLFYPSWFLLLSSRMSVQLYHLSPTLHLSDLGELFLRHFFNLPRVCDNLVHNALFLILLFLLLFLFSLSLLLPLLRFQFVAELFSQLLLRLSRL